MSTEPKSPFAPAPKAFAPSLTPPNPVTTEKLAVREFKGTKQDLLAKIAATDAPEHRKAYLAAELEQLEGSAFVMDVHIHSAHPGELIGHLHITKIF